MYPAPSLEYVVVPLTFNKHEVKKNAIHIANYGYGKRNAMVIWRLPERKVSIISEFSTFKFVNAVKISKQLLQVAVKFLVSNVKEQRKRDVEFSLLIYSSYADSGSNTTAIGKLDWAARALKKVVEIRKYPNVGCVKATEIIRILELAGAKGDAHSVLHGHFLPLRMIMGRESL